MVIIHNSTKDKILVLLISNKGKEFTIRAISKAVCIDYKTVYLIVDDLARQEIIITKKAGNTTLCSMNPKAFGSDIYRAEMIRKAQLLKNKDFYALCQHVGDTIRDPFFIMLLFGSHASGKAKDKSDIDIMVIADEGLSEKMNSSLKQIPLKIHFTSFTPSQFLNMIKTTDFNVGREAYKNNVILFGIEDYYRMISND